MSRFRHPSTKRLELWLSQGDESIDAHIASCERCASKIERLGPDGAGPLVDPLLALLSPPEDLRSRLIVQLDERLRARDDLTLIGELFGLPIRAARVITSPTRMDKE